jgi:hypothetical protein
LDFIKDTVPSPPGFRGKFDENSGFRGKGFVHHEKGTFEENCKEHGVRANEYSLPGTAESRRDGRKSTFSLRCLNGG